VLLEILTEAQFAEVSSSAAAVVVFHDRECPACYSYRPILRAWTRKNPFPSVYLVDCERFHGIADAYNIRSLPTTIVLRGGQQSNRVSGLLTEKRFANLIEKGRR
jgi:thioredoxin-like negative regulator of GroEL